jgi:DNA-binding MarR family transcriptional regulator
MDPLRRQLTDPSLTGLAEVIDLLRLMDREVPAQVIATFLYVATHEGCHKSALEEDLGLTTASGSRNTDWLTAQHRLNKPGLNLIIKEADPSNRRRTTLRLSSKGKALINRIKDALYGD